jgi:predicted RNase H-like HicB family nuclease
MKFPVIFEKSRTGYGAYSPDVPGCVAVGGSMAETRKLIKEALEFHFEGMIESGDLPLPQSTGHAEDIDVRMPKIARVLKSHRKAS